jgi:hypothetical protein
MRFRAQSLDGYRLLLDSAVAGTVLLFLARLITFFLYGTRLATTWSRYAPPDVPYLGSAALSLVLGVLLPLIDNRRERLLWWSETWRWILLKRRSRPLRRIVRKCKRVYRENRLEALDSEIRVRGNALIRTLHQAAQAGRLVSVSLTNRKWYVGYLGEVVSLEPNETHIRLLPIISGFRDKDTLATQRTIYYRSVYDEFEKTNRNISIFLLTIPMAQILEVRLFDEDVYRDHFGGD